PQGRHGGQGRCDAQPAGREDGPPEPRAHFDRREGRRDHNRARRRRSRAGRRRNVVHLTAAGRHHIYPEEPIMKRAVFVIGAAAVASLAFASQTTPQNTGTPYAHFTTSEGNFTVRLFEKDAPKTVENFIGLVEGTKEWTDPRTGAKVKKPYYNGLIFHRVIAGFMIQGG